MLKNLAYMGMALLLSIGTVPAQDPVSLDEWVKAQGLSPIIDGGAAGTEYYEANGPEIAFDGVTYSDRYQDRWLGCIANGTYLKYGLPDELTKQFSVSGYRLHSLSTSTAYKERAPRSWAIYGHANASAAADDAGWVLIDEQTDVQWPFETGAYDSTVPSTQFVLEFTLASPVTYKAYKYVPLSSKWTGSTFDTGLMELVWLGAESTAGYVVVQGSPGDRFDVSPAYGTVADLPMGTNLTFTAPANGYADNIRYRCAGYVLEKLNSDGTWTLDSTNLNANSYAYVGDGSGQRLTWLWEEDGYTLISGLEFGGSESVTVSPEPEADGYYAAGTQVSLTPVAGDSSVSVFRYWYGDVPTGMEGASPLTITMDSVKTVYAHFRRTWAIVEGTTYQITDGNWTLRLSMADDGTCGVGVDADWQAPLAGSGILDLTGVEEDTGLRLNRVEESAFRDCTDLADVILPDSITTLNTRAFQAATALRTVRLPAALATIGPYAFLDCSALVSVTPFLPETVTSIGYNAFQRCANLGGNLVISNPSITSVQGTAFSGCSSITSIDMGSSGITFIGNWAFSSCSGVTNVVLSPGLQTIDQFGFSGCTSLQTITPFLPETVQSVRSGAFGNCTSLTGDLKLSCPMLTTIASSSFSNCRKLSSVDLTGSGIITVADYSFNNCASITNLVLNDKVEIFRTYAFNGCSALANVEPFFPNSVTSVYTRAFADCAALAKPLEFMSPNTKYIGNLCFANTALTKITLPDATFRIVGSAFSNVPSTTPVYFLGKAPTEIGSGAFSAGTARRSLYVCRRMDQSGWANYITALTEEDRADASYPGRATFGILVNNSVRHWALHWNSPISDNPTFLKFQ